jgi:hypothetical protein
MEISEHHFQPECKDPMKEQNMIYSAHSLQRRNNLFQIIFEFKENCINVRVRSFEKSSYMYSQIF